MPQQQLPPWVARVIPSGGAGSAPACVILRRLVHWRLILYRVLGYATGGILFLLSHWFPNHRNRFLYQRTNLALRADVAEVVSYDGTVQIVPLRKLRLAGNQELFLALPSTAASVETFSALQRASSSLSTSVSHYATKLDADKVQDPQHPSVSFAHNADSPRDDHYVTTVLFEYRCLRYLYNPDSNTFEQIGFSLSWLLPDEVYSHLKGGIQSRDIVAQRQLLYGPSSVNVPIQPLFELLRCEIFHPFYVFQVAAIVMWFIDQYYQYACAVLIITLVSLTTEVVETRRSQIRLSNMSRFVCDIEVLRPPLQRWVTVPSTELCPGDRVRITRGMTLPCDLLLLSGTAIMNESMLSGESLPVVKAPLPSTGRLPLGRMDLASHTLSGGTYVVDERGASEALVTRTGFSTAQGLMMQSILHPPPDRRTDFKFDTYKFLAVLALLALVAAILTVIVCINQGLTVQATIIRSLDVFPNAVPPALPATMSVGATLAVTKLKRLCNVLCMSPSKINIAGQVSTIVFDKTGTLTTDSVTLEAVVPSADDPDAIPDRGNTSRPVYNFRSAMLSTADLPLMVRTAFATCQSLCQIDGEPCGDPLDMELFKMSAASFVNGDESDVQWDGERWRVVQRFDFVPALQRMSVVAEDSVAGVYYLFCKGSPEKLMKLCRPETVPINFSTTLREYTSRGKRVLSVAWRPLQEYETAGLLERDAAELELNFGCLAVFANMLKPTTAGAIADLKASSVRCIVATGDNASTATAVAQECDLQASTTSTLTLQVEADETEPRYGLRWQCISPATNNTHHAAASWHSGGSGRHMNTVDTERLPGVLEGVDPRKVCLVVTGPAFRRLAAVHEALALDWAPFDVEFRSQYVKRLSSLCTRNECSSNTSCSSKKKAKRTWMDVVRNRSGRRVSLECDDSECCRTVRRRVIGLSGSTHTQQSEEIGCDDSDDNLELLITSQREASENEPFMLRAYVEAEDREVNFSAFEWTLRFGRIFARMTPDDKAFLITSIQELPCQPLVGMCGDGANDCAALRTADIGIALSDKEASIAAPFTSTAKSVTSVVDILREGRGALVNSFQSFKFLALYAMLQVLGALALYLYGNNFSDPQYLWLDLALVLPLSITMAWTGSSRALTTQLPDRHLAGFGVVLSLIGQLLLQITFLSLMLALLACMPWYQRYYPQTDLTIFTPADLASYENTTVLIMVNFQLIAINVVLACGRPWRKAPLTNHFFSCYILAMLVVAVFAFLFPIRPLRFLHQWAALVDLPGHFRCLIASAVAVDAVATLAFERYIVAGWAYRRTQRSDTGSQYIDVLLPRNLDLKVRFKAQT